MALLAPVGAQAGDDALFVTLDYRAEPSLGCPPDADFRRLVSDQLGYDPFHAAAADQVSVIARRGKAGIEGFVHWSDAALNVKGTRELRSDTLACDELARELAFALAVQIQLLGEERARAGTAPEPNPEVPSPPARAETQTRDRLEATHSDRIETPVQSYWLVGGGPGIAVGLGPSAIPEAQLFLAARRSWLSLELGAEAGWPTRLRTRDGTGFEYHATALALSLCGHWGAFAGCAHGRLTRIQVRGFGVDAPRSAAGLLFHTGVRGLARQALGRGVFGGLHLDVLATPSPHSVELNDTGVWTTPAGAILAGAEVAAQFP